MHMHILCTYNYTYVYIYIKSRVCYVYIYIPKYVYIYDYICTAQDPGSPTLPQRCLLVASMGAVPFAMPVMAI